MPKTLVNQGRYIMSADPVCGTNGLGTCVGIAVYHGHWFIAHVDCAAVVRTRADPMRQRVANYVRNRLTQLLGPCGSPNVHVVGGLGDFSAQAISEGVTAWVNGTVAITLDAWDGFEILAGDVFQRIGADANNSAGDGAFSVPDNP
jgi:hypothetical protein